ncbi:CFI-box-CTERM domain-containing protein [Flavobacterium sp.]|uniref:CFI-box-CTERM domain-containing protein n=1 Tax=Flavobacterium sp. TaxID=239 RepID=UPI004048792D
MERRHTTEIFDKFSNSKTISTNRIKKFGGWTETHEPNQSIQILNNDVVMTSLTIDFKVRIYTTIVSVTNGNEEEFYFEVLNYFYDGYADKANMQQDFSNTKLDFVIDGQNMSSNSVMINDGVNSYARSGLINKEIFTRNQLLKYPISKEQFKKFCDGTNISMRISGINNPVRINKDFELSEDVIKSIQDIAKQFYNEAIQSNSYLEPRNNSVKTSKSGKNSGCFIATATMGDYNHPVVLDLRLFRDNWLLKRNWGINFTNMYYKHSPKIADFIEKSKFLKFITFILIVKPLQLITKLLK